jgi:RNA polymerase-binding transcription factor DksA
MVRHEQGVTRVAAQKKPNTKAGATSAKKTVKKAPAKTSTTKKAPAKKVVAKKAPAKKAPAKKPSASKVAKKAPAKKVAAKKAPAKKSSATKVAAKKTPAKKTSATTVAKKAPVAQAAPKKAEPKRHVIVKGPSQDGVTSTKDFDLKFLLSQRQSLQEERAKLLGQANRLEDEANALIADAEMGDVQFDDEGGEGDTMVVERERDQVLSAQARQTVELIDAALARMKKGEYGYSQVSGVPIPKERLKALPWATELVTERAGGLGRR